MEITLEAVEKVMAEAEVEFAEAKAALIGADGNAEAAIEAIKASRAAVEEAADEVQDLGVLRLRINLFKFFDSFVQDIAAVPEMLQFLRDAFTVSHKASF